MGIFNGILGHFVDQTIHWLIEGALCRLIDNKKWSFVGAYQTAFDFGMIIFYGVLSKLSLTMC